MSAVDRVVQVLEAAGWNVAHRETVAAGRLGPNPTRLDLIRGTSHLPLLAYAWEGTHEGQGRTGPNYRVQTTRAHDGDLLIEPNRLTVGFGIDPRRNVIFIFDGWTKRTTGSSSSVHIKRKTLEEAARVGYAEQGPEHDARGAATPDNIDRLLEWAIRQRGERQAVVRALDYVAGNHAKEILVRADMWAGAASKWLRPGDKLVVANKNATRVVNDGVWAVEDLTVEKVSGDATYPRHNVIFRCRRIGRVENPIKVLHSWPGGHP